VEKVMSGTRVEARRTRSRNKVFALAAAGIVLVAGITVPSLAAWTDSEWVTGGVGNIPGISTSSFEVEQFAAGDTIWDHYETQGVANVIDFSAQAASLAPGDTVYGYVRLRTEAGSLGGTLTLAADTVVTASTLSAAVVYGARVVSSTAECSAANYAASGTLLQASGSALNASSLGTFSLAAAPDATTPGAEKVVCFELEFPISFAGDETLMRSSVAPVWHFDAVSV
jgi:predicted ribosomally synthesized peptide with SipW-like signal peptide